MSWDFIALAAALVMADIPPPSGAAQVTLGTPRAHVDAQVLTLSAEAHNALAWPVDGITVGVLYAADRAALEKADPRRAYDNGPADASTVKHVALNLAPGGRALATLQVTLPPDAEPPTIFAAHVLGYSLADADAATLLDLVGTEAAADEWAACAAFGLTGDERDRRAARQRWSAHAQLKGDLAEGLLLPIAAKPTQRETFRRVFAARALGVLGGPAAEDTLGAWREDPDLPRFDSALQVLRVGRVSGSPFETPLAFAVPPDAIHMRDLVDAALDDARHLGQALALPSGGLHAPAIVDPDPPWWTQRDAWILMGMGLTVGVAWLLLRRT